MSSLLLLLMDPRQREAPPLPPQPRWYPFQSAGIPYHLKTLHVLQERLHIFIKTTPEHPNKQRIIKLIEDHIPLFQEKLTKLDDLKKTFLCDVLVAQSRSWEAMRKTPDGRVVFPEWTEPYIVFSKIHDDWSPLSNSFYSIDYIQLDLLDSGSELVQRAKNNLKDHLDVVGMIDPDTTTPQHIELFVGEIEFYWFSGPGLTFYGMSSVDGKRVYVNSVIPNYDIMEMREDIWVVTIEHELMHNISRWRATKELKDENWFKISPEKNPVLRSKGGEMVEAGFYYEEQVYGYESVYTKYNRRPSPFCIKTSPFSFH